jgi:RNA-splicing ligase RtcB
MLHSGSRNIGKELAERHIAVARGLPHNADLPDRDLAVFVAGTPEMAAYRRDLTLGAGVRRPQPRGDARAVLRRGPARGRQGAVR